MALVVPAAVSFRSTPLQKKNAEGHLDPDSADVCEEVYSLLQASAFCSPVLVALSRKPPIVFLAFSLASSESSGGVLMVGLIGDHATSVLSWVGTP